METRGVIEEETAHRLLQGLWPLPCSQLGAWWCREQRKISTVRARVWKERTLVTEWKEPKKAWGEGAHHGETGGRWKSGWEVVPAGKGKGC